MSDEIHSRDEPANLSRDEMMSVLFAQMVVQQSNLAMMLLGKVPHPQSGETVRDLEAARLFIDQLEMLEAKTKGNLSAEEAALLKQSLMALRMAFVEAVEKPGPSDQSAAAANAPASQAAGNPELQNKISPAAAPAEEESRKKFSKKYSG